MTKDELIAAMTNGSQPDYEVFDAFVEFAALGSELVINNVSIESGVLDLRGEYNFFIIGTTDGSDVDTILMDEVNKQVYLVNGTSENINFSKYENVFVNFSMNEYCVVSLILYGTETPQLASPLNSPTRNRTKEIEEADGEIDCKGGYDRYNITATVINSIQTILIDDDSNREVTLFNETANAIKLVTGGNIALVAETSIPAGQYIQCLFDGASNMVYVQTAVQERGEKNSTTVISENGDGSVLSSTPIEILDTTINVNGGGFTMLNIELNLMGDFGGGNEIVRAEIAGNTGVFTITSVNTADRVATTDTASRFCVYFDSGVLKFKNNVGANIAYMFELKASYIN